MWTLTHSYFANMGGLANPRSLFDERITAHMIAHSETPGVYIK
jgi:hypothetical protein